MKLVMSNPKSEKSEEEEYESWKIEELARSLINIEKCKSDKKKWQKVISKAKELVAEKRKEAEAGEMAIKKASRL